MGTPIKDPRFFIRMNILEDFLDVIDTYEENKNLFKSKNDFLKVCLLKGLKEVKKEITGLENLEIKNEKITIRSEEDKYSKAIIVLLSNIYEMLVGLSIGKPKSLHSIKKDYWEKLPERFAIILKED